MPLIYRSANGAPLTTEEVDGNFRALANRIEALETSPPDAEGIASIEVDKGEICFRGTRGTTFGTVSLPKIFWNPRGPWKAETHYAGLDVVSINHTLYVCRMTHTSSSEFSLDSWIEFFSFPVEEKKEPSNPPDSQANLAFLQPFPKENLPNNPRLGALVLLVAPHQSPEPIYWNGERWCKVKDGDEIPTLDYEN